MKKYYSLYLLLLFFSISASAEGPISKGVVEAIEIVNTYTLSQFANMDCRESFSRCDCKVEMSPKGNETPHYYEYGSTRIDGEFRPNISSGNIRVDWPTTVNNDDKTILPVVTTSPFESAQKCRREVNEWIGEKGKEFQFAEIYYRVGK